jgi:hypothetical protein
MDWIGNPVGVGVGLVLVLAPHLIHLDTLCV